MRKDGVTSGRREEGGRSYNREEARPSTTAQRKLGNPVKVT